MTAPRYAACRCGHAKGDHDGELAPQCTGTGCTCLQYRPDTAKGTPIPAPVAFVRREPTPPPRLDKQAVRELVAAPEPPAPPAPPVAPEPPVHKEPDIVARGERPSKLSSIESLLHEGKRSQFKRTVALTEKIALMVHDLRGRVADEREAAEQAARDEATRAEAGARIAELEKQLAEARAALPPVKAAARKAAAEAPEKVTPQGTCPDCGKSGLSNIGVHRAKKHGYRRAGAA